ncbi:MAG: dihydrofolate reductase [Methylococcaceae bacterium]
MTAESRNGKDIALVVAMTENRVIGRDGAMPWHIPADLKHFRRLTWGKPIIMGRKTFESLGRPLPGRQNIIISGNSEFHPEHCITVSTPQAALAVAAPSDIMIIGGATIYQAFLPAAQYIYLTLIHVELTGDTWFPEWDYSDWLELENTRIDHDPECGLSYSFIRLERRDTANFSLNR